MAMAKTRDKPEIAGSSPGLGDFCILSKILFLKINLYERLNGRRKGGREGRFGLK